MLSSTKAWFVTGSTGLGRAVIEHALQQGDHVIMLRQSELESLGDLLPKYASQLVILSSDVKNPEQIHLAFKNAFERFGRIDIVFNNAEAGVFSEAEGVSDEDGRELFDILFWRVMNVSKEAVKIFRDRNNPPGGRLLQVSSQAASRVPPGVAHYAAAKAALESLSEGLAAELDPDWNIKISVIQPGSFRTTPGWINAASPIHPAYSDPSLPSRRARDELAIRKLDGDPKKLAQRMYRLAHMDEPPFYVPLHREAVQAVKAKGEDFIRAAKEYASWSDNIYFIQN